MSSSFGLEPWVISVRDQCVLITSGNEPYGTATTAVAPIGPPAGNVLLPPEANRSSPPVAGLHFDMDLVDEHGPGFLSERGSHVDR